MRTVSTEDISESATLQFPGIFRADAGKGSKRPCVKSETRVGIAVSTLVRSTSGPKQERHSAAISSDSEATEKLLRFGLLSGFGLTWTNAANCTHDMRHGVSHWQAPCHIHSYYAPGSHKYTHQTLKKPRSYQASATRMPSICLGRLCSSNVALLACGADSL